MITLVRRRAQALIGTSQPPYKDWMWKDCGHCLGGPNFLILPNGNMWAAGRVYIENADDSKGYTEGDTAMGLLTEKAFQPLLFLPSAGDNSYPGMVYQEGSLFISYYSSHEGKACIYFAEIRLH